MVGNYKKPLSVKKLEADYFIWYYNFKDNARHANFPEGSRVKFSFRDDTANGLTKAIEAWFKINNGQIARINTMGIYDYKLKKYRTSGSTKGVADLVGTFRGRSVSIEVKIGRDKQSEKQVKYQQEVEKAGGIYIIASSFGCFISEFSKHFGVFFLEPK